MTAEAQSQTASRIALRVHLQSGVCSIPLHLVHHLTGYATLTGQPDDYFLGWLTFHGEQIPVFDLNRVVCDEPTPERFGSRIVLLEAAAGTTVRYIGLLAGGMTDTVSGNEAEALDLGSYLPMLYTMIPELPAAAA